MELKTKMRAKNEHCKDWTFPKFTCETRNKISSKHGVWLLEECGKPEGP